MSLQRYTSIHPVADLPQLMAMLEATAVARAQQREQRAEAGAGKGSWYTIRNASDDEAEIFIYDEIGYWGTTANDFVSELREIKASKIALHINSPGGDVFDGIAIYNALVRHKADITVYIDGIAASAASFIAMCGDTVVMCRFSQMMIHEASGLCIGPADDMRKMADVLDKASDNIAAIYATRADGDVAEWRSRMKDETWISDREAVEMGLADRVEGDDEETAAAARTQRMQAQALAQAQAQAQAETPEAEAEPEPETPAPKPVDWAAVLEQIEEEAEDELFVLEGVAS